MATPYPKLDTFIEESLINESELVAKHTKTVALNNLWEQIQSARKNTSSTSTIAKLNALVLVIEDMFKVDMYKFQFKAATENIKSDLEAIKRIIANEV